MSGIGGLVFDSLDIASSEWRIACDLAEKLLGEKFMHSFTVAMIAMGSDSKSFAQWVYTFPLMTVAVLHDILEDTTITKEQLLETGISEQAVEIVDILTRKEGEDYFKDYLPRIKEHPIARRVKLADLHHNSQLHRLSRHKDGERLASKYIRAYRFLDFAGERDMTKDSAESKDFDPSLKSHDWKDSDKVVLWITGMTDEYEAEYAGRRERDYTPMFKVTSEGMFKDKILKDGDYIIRRKA